MKNNMWIQKAVKKPNRVRSYVRKLFGQKAFTNKNTIKYEYLLKAKSQAEKSNNQSLVKAINLAINLKKLKK
jgi:hypothetical protein